LQWAGGSGRANQNVDGTAKSHARPIDRERHLLGIRDIGANAQGIAAGLLDFDVRQIDFGLAAPHQRNFRA
jgi:hypothetical protein